MIDNRFAIDTGVHSASQLQCIVAAAAAACSCIVDS